MKTVLFWVIMQRVVVIPYCFGTTYQSHLQGTRIQDADGTSKLSPNVSTEITTTHCVIAQKRVVLRPYR
jgi:hypothetical protein